jgi:uncharacterized protein YecE (DUF72 family)
VSVRVGPAGWSYRDWNGAVYPEPRPAGFDELRFIAERFGCIEINSSFYRPPAPRTAESWARRTEGLADFRFTAKLWQRFTHESAPWGAAEAATFEDGMRPLVEAGRLGALLAQFPWSFRDGPQARDRLRRLAESFRRVPLVVEVRHASWGPSVPFFGEIGAGFCNVDQPASRTSLQGTEHVTGPIGYVRLHGRNARAWFSQDAGRDERYDYLYRPEELRPWVEAARRMASTARDVYVVTNNHFRGQGVVNAIQLMLDLTGRAPEVPEGLRPLIGGTAR